MLLLFTARVITTLSGMLNRHNVLLQDSSNLCIIQKIIYVVENFSLLQITTQRYVTIWSICV